MDIPAVHVELNRSQMKYSEDELAEAARAVREDALFFRGLDWENASSKWGHVTTPWREHYPNCWNDLYKVTNHIQASRACMFVLFLYRMDGRDVLLKNSVPGRQGRGYRFGM